VKQLKSDSDSDEEVVIIKKHKKKAKNIFQKVNLMRKMMK